MISNKSKGRHRVHIYKLKHWRVLRKCSAWKIPQKMLSPNFASSICFLLVGGIFFLKHWHLYYWGGKAGIILICCECFLFWDVSFHPTSFFLTDLGSSKLVPPVNRWNFRRSRMSFQQKWGGVTGWQPWLVIWMIRIGHFDESSFHD